jgi:hypothetical protein
LSEFQQLGDGCLFALSKGWAHIAIITHFTINVELFRRVYIEGNIWKRKCHRREADFDLRFKD